MPQHFQWKATITLSLLLNTHLLLATRFNIRRPTFLNNSPRNKRQNERIPNDKRTVIDSRFQSSLRKDAQRTARDNIEKPTNDTEDKDKGFVIVIDANKPDPGKVTKRDQLTDSGNDTSKHDEEIQKDIYDQLKTRFEKIEEHLASFSKQPTKDEPQVRVIVITPKSLNISDDKNLNLLDLENTAAFSKDNLFVKEISSKEYDDTFVNSLQKKEESQSKSRDDSPADRSVTHENGKEANEPISPLLADKDTLNEVVREINLLRNYSKNESALDNNLLLRNDNEKGEQHENILEDVMLMAKGEAIHHDAVPTHDDDTPTNQKDDKPKESIEGKKPANTNEEHANEEHSIKKETSLGLQVITDAEGNKNDSSKENENEAQRKKKEVQLQPPSNPEPKSLDVNLPHYHTMNLPEPGKKHTVNDEKKEKVSASPVEQITKEIEKNLAAKRNSSQIENVDDEPQKKTTDENKEKPESRKVIIDKQKAEAIIEFLNKDPLEVWRYSFKNLHSLDLNSTLLRSGLVNAGNIERLKGVMRRALEGKSVTISVVGGSISAGGGLYKDEKSIAGLYYKGLIDWWQKMITPLTGADMLVNNVAIGSIGTDYFSYCVKNHIANESDIVLWELSANDYNRYKMQPTKGARPLERFTRMVLELPNKPALLYINFFKGVDFKASRVECPDFEDQGEDIIAHYYKIPSLSWRAMVCNGLVNKQQGYSMQTLFSLDEYHPSIRGHAQMSLLILLHLRHVMRAVLQWAIAHDGFIERFEDHYTIPEPLFMGPRYPEPLCWSLISPDLNQKLTNSLFVRVKTNDGFKLEYATNFPIRFDKVVCWKAERPRAEIALQFYIPEDYGPTGLKRDRSEVAITTHTRWGGSSTIWIDDKVNRTIVIEEGREHDPGKRTQVDSLLNDVRPGYHILHVRAHEGGFCLSAIMVDSS